MLRACNRFTVLDDTGLPTHKPLTIHLSLDAFCRRALRPQRPLAFPSSAGPAPDPATQWDRIAPAWHAALHHHNGPDIDTMWSLFCSAAEAYLTDLHALHLDRPPQRYHGRAACKPPRLAPVVAPQGRGDQYGALTHRHLRLLKLVRQLEAHAHARTSLSALPPGPLPHNEIVLWQRITTAATDLLDPGLAWASPLLLATPPSLDLLPPLLVGLRALSIAQYDRLKRARSDSWTSWVRSTWDAGQLGRLYNHTRGGTATPATILQRTDSSLTADPTEMDALLRAAWGPIFRLYATSPEPAWEPFATRFGQHIIANPLAADELTDLDLRLTLQRQSVRSACGPDGWRVAELRALPQFLLVHLATFLNCVERLGKWPPALCQAWITLIPKGSSLSPLDQRPISVASAVYRLWAATRLRYAVDWQAGWLDDSQCGFRPQHSAVDAYWAIALAIEEALLAGTPLTGAFLDYAKCFDRLPHGILLSLAHKSGMDSKVLRPLTAVYATLDRRFKVGGGIGTAFRPTNGILQGCPLSVILINLLQSVWTRAVRAETAASPTSYADDATLLGTRPAVEAAGELTLQFCSATGQLLNTKKCVAFDTAAHPTPLRFGNKPLPMDTVTRCLGSNITLSANAAQAPHVAERLQKAIDTLRRIGNLPLSFPQRAHMALTQPCAAAFYGAETTDWLPAQEFALESALLQAVWGRGRSNRCREVFFAVLLRGHRADPKQALPYLRLCGLLRMIQRHPPLLPRIQRVLHLLRSRPAPLPTDRGPIALALTAIHQLHWQWSVPWTITTSSTTSLLDSDPASWAHEVRQATRYRRLQPAADRRPDLQGCTLPLDLEATNSAWQRNLGGPYLSGAIRSVLTGAVWTADRRHRAHLTTSGNCPHCPAAPLETPEHMFWECPAWAAIRASFPSLATSGPWPPCFRLCGIVPLALAPTATRRLELAHTVQSMLARILTARNPAPADAAAPGAAPPRPASHPPPAVPWLYTPDGPTTTFPHFLPVPSPTFWIYSPAHFCAFRSYIGRLLWPASPPDVRPPPSPFSSSRSILN